MQWLSSRRVRILSRDDTLRFDERPEELKPLVMVVLLLLLLSSSLPPLPPVVLRVENSLSSSSSLTALTTTGTTIGRDRRSLRATADYSGKIFARDGEGSFLKRWINFQRVATSKTRTISSNWIIRRKTRDARGDLSVTGSVYCTSAVCVTLISIL